MRVLTRSWILLGFQSAWGWEVVRSDFVTIWTHFKQKFIDFRESAIQKLHMWVSASAEMDLNASAHNTLHRHDHLAKCHPVPWLRCHVSWHQVCCYHVPDPQTGAQTGKGQRKSNRQMNLRPKWASGDFPCTSRPGCGSV